MERNLLTYSDKGTMFDFKKYLLALFALSYVKSILMNPSTYIARIPKKVVCAAVDSSCFSDVIVFVCDETEFFGMPF